MAFEKIHSEIKSLGFSKTCKEAEKFFGRSSVDIIMESGGANLEDKLTDTIEEDLLTEGAVHGAPRNKCPFTIEPILLALCMADGLSGAVTVNFILTRTCEIHFKFNKSICSQLDKSNKSNVNETDINDIIQPYSTIIITGLNILSTFLPGIMSFFLGPWSDYNGRKLMIILPALGYFLKYVMLGVFSFFPNLGPEYGLLVVLPVALSGGFINFISAAYAYVSDITSEVNRSLRIGLLEAVLFCGFNIGFLSASYIYTAGRDYGYVLIYGLSASIIFITVVFTYFYVPESVENTDRGKGLRHVFEYKLVKEMLKLIFKKRAGYQRAVTFLVIASLSISSAIVAGESNVLFLFTKLHFGWGIQEFSLWVSVVFTTMFLGIFLGIYIFIKWLKIPDAKLGILIYGLKAVNSFCIAFIPTNAPYLMYYSGLINIFQGLGSAISRAILSKAVPKEDLDSGGSTISIILCNGNTLEMYLVLALPACKIFSLTSTSESIFPLVIGPLYTVLYNATIETLPSTFFLISGSLFILCFIFFGIIDIFHKLDTQTQFSWMENERETG